MDNWELLITVSNEVELGLISTILKNNDIIFIIKDSAAIGGYMKIYGRSIYGTDIYVKSNDLNVAKDLIANFLYVNPSDEYKEEKNDEKR